MRIGPFIPCFIGAFAPEVAIATLGLLERFGRTMLVHGRGHSPEVAANC